MKRLDAWMVELKLVPSRTRAQRLIESGEVSIFYNDQWQIVTRSSAGYAQLDDAMIRINSAAPLLQYVSRGGLKLEGALKHLQLNLKGWRALDVGISTGGFTDCLLQQGCREVIGIDVGHGQLAAPLIGDSRVQHFEGINVRQIQDEPEICTAIAKGLELCVVDVSFVSLTLVIPPLVEVLPNKTDLLLLVKPQFELGPEALGKNGVVRDPELHIKAVQQVLRSLEKCGFSETVHFASEVKGQDGNQEYFIHAKRA